MNKWVFLILGILASASIANADVYRYGQCQARGGNQYVLFSDFTRGYPSIGTDRGGHNFDIGTVRCGRSYASVNVLEVNSNRVVIAINGGRDDRGYDRGYDRHYDRRDRDERRGDCVVDASMRWETTRFNCR